MDNLFSLFEAIFLIFASSADALAAGFSYSADGINIPLRSVFIIDFICTVLLFSGFLLADFIGVFLPPYILGILCFIILFSVALLKLFECFIKSWIKKHKISDIPSHYMRHLLQIFLDATKADFDRSKTLSAKEALSLGIALSLDGLATGFGAGLLCDGFGMITVLFFAVNFIMLEAGTVIGRRIGANMSWIGGIVLMALAIFKLF